MLHACPDDRSIKIHLTNLSRSNRTTPGLSTLGHYQRRRRTKVDLFSGLPEGIIAAMAMRNLGKSRRQLCIEATRIRFPNEVSPLFALSNDT
jgi:hypothetical protein